MQEQEESYSTLDDAGRTAVGQMMRFHRDDDPVSHKDMQERLARIYTENPETFEMSAIREFSTMAQAIGERNTHNNPSLNGSAATPPGLNGSAHHSTPDFDQAAFGLGREQLGLQTGTANGSVALVSDASYQALIPEYQSLVDAYIALKEQEAKKDEKKPAEELGDEIRNGVYRDLDGLSGPALHAHMLSLLSEWVRILGQRAGDAGRMLKQKEVERKAAELGISAEDLEKDKDLQKAMRADQHDMNNAMAAVCGLIDVLAKNIEKGEIQVTDKAAIDDKLQEFLLNILPKETQMRRRPEDLKEYDRIKLINLIKTAQEQINSGTPLNKVIEANSANGWILEEFSQFLKSRLPKIDIAAASHDEINEFRHQQVDRSPAKAAGQDILIREAAKMWGGIDLDVVVSADPSTGVKTINALDGQRPAQLGIANGTTPDSRGSDSNN